MSTIGTALPHQEGARGQRLPPSRKGVRSPRRDVIATTTRCMLGMTMTQDAHHQLTRRAVCALGAAICLWGEPAMAADGLTSIKSSYGPTETMNRLEADVKARGLTVFARIDHAAGAAAAGLTLRPTDLLIFANPRRPTPFIHSAHTLRLALPLKP